MSHRHPSAIRHLGNEGQNRLAVGELAQLDQSMHLRPANMDDARAIATVQVRSWQGGYVGIVPEDALDAMSIDDRTATWAQRLAGAPAGGISVAVADDEVVGYIALAPSVDADATPSTASVASIYVLPTSWRCGAGKRLMGDALERLRAAGAIDVTLWAFADNARGRHFYESMGFRADGETRSEWWGGALLPEVRFRHHLDSTE